MLCQHCKKNIATNDYIEIINDKMYESHLCSECYADLYGELHAKANNDLWAELFATPSKRLKVCPVCGTTYAEYEKSGLLGCTSCYDVFKEELIPIIKRIQGKVEHVGKIAGNNDNFGLHRQLKSLQEKLETALREKRFIDAGKLNKQIDAIKKKLNGGENNG